MMNLLMLAANDETMLGFTGIMAGVGVVAIIFGTIRRTAETKHREQSRREIAAYIAEGSMSPEQGERLMNAGGKSSRCT